MGASGWKIPKEDLRELEGFFKREDKLLKQKQKESIKQVLTEHLQEPQKAFIDLIYVIETAVSLGIIEEKEILPVFYELYGLRKELNKEDVSEKLKDIQAQLRKVISLDAL